MKVYQNKKTGGWQFNFTLDRKQHQIYLGKNHTAVSAARVVETIKELLLCRFRAERPSSKLLQQIRRLDSKVLATIRKHGLFEFHDANLTLGQLTDEFLKQKSGVKPATMEAYLDKLGRLQRYFGEKTLVTKIGETEIAEFKTHLLDEKSLSPVTVGWTIRVVRSMFRFGVKQRLCLENPFEDIYPGPKSNDNNYRYIEQSDIETILKPCRKAETAFAVRLARYGGLRMPSEIRNMRFSDFGTDGFFVHDNSKTGRREVPFFHQLRPDFEILKHKKDKDDFVFSRQIVVAENLRSRFETLIRRAGFEQWPRLFNNLRASRVTELDEEGYNAKTLDSIFGNTESIRNRHYVGFRRDVAFMRMLGEQARPLRELVESGGQSESQFDISERKIIKEISDIETETQFLHENRSDSLVFS